MGRSGEGGRREERKVRDMPLVFSMLGTEGLATVAVLRHYPYFYKHCCNHLDIGLVITLLVPVVNLRVHSNWQQFVWQMLTQCRD